ncbi:MAG TPA: hypothetical protein VL997_07975 [Dyella sp.]|nr:hypothetical protein [Dyella sp.]
MAKDTEKSTGVDSFSKPDLLLQMFRAELHSQAWTKRALELHNKIRVIQDESVAGSTSPELRRLQADFEAHVRGRFKPD